MLVAMLDIDVRSIRIWDLSLRWPAPLSPLKPLEYSKPAAKVTTHDFSETLGGR